MSSSATPPSRKRTHSLEQGGERSPVDINTKKPRISPEAPPRRSGKRKRSKKKQTVSAVEDIADSSSTRSHNDGTEPMNPQAQRRSARRGKSRRMVESEEEDSNIAPRPTPHSQATGKSQTNVASTSSSTSSSPSIKGKEREVEFVPFLSTSDTEDLSKKTEDLNQQLDAQITKLAVHSALISSFKDSLTCQICVDLMYKPFTLAPCGHIACYSCLVGWFKSNVAEDEGDPQSVYRKKTCPHCRSAVRDHPIENFTIKEMVNSLVNSGVLEDVQGVTAITATTADPWAGIFPKHPVREDNYEGLPFPLFDEEDDEDDYEVGDMGVYDHDDDVYRCRGCMNEVVNGFCTSCERGYQPALTVDAFPNGLFGGYGGGLWDINVDSESDEEDEESQGYEPSFIDDDEAAGGGLTWDVDPATLPPLHEDSDEGDGDDAEIDPPPVVRQRVRLAPIVISSDEEDASDRTDTDTHGDYGRCWNEEVDDEGDYHDARSDCDDPGEDDYMSDGQACDASSQGSFYGYL